MRNSQLTGFDASLDRWLRPLLATGCLAVIFLNGSVACGQVTDAETSDQDKTDESSEVDEVRKVTNPFLWKVSKKDAEDDVKHYLFGTIHVPDEWITTLHPDAQSAFDNADAAYFEVDMVKDQDAQLEAISLPDDQKLEDLIPEALLKRLDARLQSINQALTRDNIPACRVVVWPLLIGNLEAQLRELGKPPMDVKLYVMAVQDGKTVGGLEDPKSQLESLISLPLEEQIEFLKATLDQLDEDEDEKESQLERTMQMYAQGRDEEFLKFFMDEFQDLNVSDPLRQKILKALLDERNEAIATRIEELLSDKPDQSHFFAVGTAHLLGKNSVQDYLKKNGYTVERVEAGK